MHRPVNDSYTAVHHVVRACMCVCVYTIHDMYAGNVLCVQLHHFLHFFSLIAGGCGGLLCWIGRSSKPHRQSRL
jgi:hypothetical protein